MDTLHVFQNDTSVFKSTMFRFPCSKEWLFQYDLINPIESTCYFIYDANQRLVKEGKYICLDTIVENCGFYDSKNYSYRRSGSLDKVIYMDDGRQHKTAFFDRKGRLIKVQYYDKKSSNIDKIEIYKKGQLKKTQCSTLRNQTSSEQSVSFYS